MSASRKSSDASSTDKSLQMTVYGSLIHQSPLQFAVCSTRAAATRPKHTWFPFPFLGHIAELPAVIRNFAFLFIQSQRQASCRAKARYMILLILTVRLTRLSLHRKTRCAKRYVLSKQATINPSNTTINKKITSHNQLHSILCPSTHTSARTCDCVFLALMPLKKFKFDTRNSGTQGELFILSISQQSAARTWRESVFFATYEFFEAL